jgi:hypothetical protein
MTKFTKFIVGASVALALAVTAITTTHAAFMYSGTLKMGSHGSQVLSLQQTLNMTACKVSSVGAGSPGHETSTFSAKTRAAVKCFQAANGISTTGQVGPLTGAALAAVSGGSVSTGLPAGCASASGYSTVNGAPCSGTPGTTVFPAGCVSSVGYSSTTGQSCSGSSTGVVTSGPFSINSTTPVSGYLATSVGVGAQDKVIGDLRIVSGAGGSANLTGVNVSFFNRGTGDYQFIKYASSVSVWLNGVKVGTLPATSFTQYNSQYSAFIPVSGAALNPSTTNDLQLSVSALPVIDSANLGSTANTWAYEMQTLRYTDSSGSFSYTVPSGSSFDGGNITTGTLQSSAVFSSASSANSITLTVSKDANDYNDHVVSGATGATTQNVTLATLDLAAHGSAVSINRLPVTINTNNPGTGDATTGSASVINTLRLYNAAGAIIDSETVPSVAGATSAVVTFQNLNMSIPAGSTQVLTVKGDLNAVDGTIVGVGSTARVDATSANVAAIQAYDQSNNVLTGTTILIGSTTGSTVTFYVNGIQVSSTAAGTASASGAGGAQSHSVLGFTIPFSVTAFGQQAYVPSFASASTAGTGTGQAIQFCVDNFNGACQAVGTGVITYNGSDGLTPDTANNYVIPAGQTKNFTLQITYTANGAASYRASLLNVTWSNSDVTSGFTTFTAGLNSNAFKTNYVSAQ